jgi:hypothetical protein
VTAAGERLFARYAHQPNERGYCGPEGADGLAAVARGEAASVSVPDVARRFSGAWPYLTVVGGLLGVDPLDERAVRAYWTGSAEGDALDADEVWRRLVAIIGPQAGSYWTHLDDRLAAEAAPHHAFHVFGVYPWTRLLDTGLPEPVQVLADCSVVPARVREVVDDGCLVDAPALYYADGRLSWGEAAPRRVSVPYGDLLAGGDAVTVHWDAVCERIDDADAAALAARLASQLERVNARLAAALPR